MTCCEQGSICGDCGPSSTFFVSPELFGRLASTSAAAQNTSILRDDLFFINGPTALYHPITNWPRRHYCPCSIRDSVRLCPFCLHRFNPSHQHTSAPSAKPCPTTHLLHPPHLVQTHHPRPPPLVHHPIRFQPDAKTHPCNQDLPDPRVPFPPL